MSLPRNLHCLLCLLPLLGLQAAVAAEPAASAASAGALQISDGGQTVTDTRTRLVWARCVEGMHWDGKQCAGEPQRLSFAQASALAQQRAKAEGLRWRLPRVNELSRLVDRAATPPGPDPRLFPQAPRDWHWSGSAKMPGGPSNPYAYKNVMQGRTAGSGDGEAFLLGWAVDMGSARTRDDVAKSTRLPLRLVRGLD